MNRDEFLQRFHLPKLQHRSLSSSERQVTVLNPVVEPAADLLTIAIAQFGELSV